MKEETQSFELFIVAKGISMNRAFVAAVLGSLLLVTVGCKQKVDPTAAIRDGVVKYLSTRAGLNMSNMDITVTKTTVNANKAQADVEVRAKNSEPGSPAMRLTYELQQQGAEWVVLKSQANGGMQHPDPGAMTQQGEMPAGHPPTAGASGQTPADHPDFNSILNSAQPPPPQQGTTPPTTQPPSSNAKP
jgi:hypothetical protein